MVEVRHRTTSEVLLKVEGDTLELADLRGVDLRGADLYGQDLYNADLTEVDLREADLSLANLTGAMLDGALLVDAELDGANMTGVSLKAADVRGANLTNVRFTNTTLFGANLTHARLCATLFEWCYDLYKAVGLDNVRHVAPSTLDRTTIVQNVAGLPDDFLYGVGYTPFDIREFRRIYAPLAPYHSCFISYRRTKADIEFVVNRLYPDLMANNVPCWIDVHDMKGGRYFPTQLSLAIKDYDKVILVCSRSSLTRNSVVEEITTALDIEKESGSVKLFPITLDSFVTGKRILEISEARMRSQEWRADWVRRIRRFHILNFSKWRDPVSYQAEFDKLLLSLTKQPE